MYAEGGLVEKSEDDEIPVMSTGLDHQVPMTEVNNNYVNSSVMFPRGNTYTIGKVIRRKEMQVKIMLEGGTTIPYLTLANIVLSLIMGRSENW